LYRYDRLERVGKPPRSQGNPDLAAPTLYPGTSQAGQRDLIVCTNFSVVEQNGKQKLCTPGKIL